MKKKILLFFILCITTAFFWPASADAESGWQIVDIPSGTAEKMLPFALQTGYLASDIATDINGNLYVMSESHIYRFDPSGARDKTWANEGVLYDEEMERTNSEQMGIAADSRGYVYASCRIRVDGSPSYIKRYTPQGKPDTSWYGDGVMGGKVGTDSVVKDECETGGEGLSGQEDIALDAKDNLYVLQNGKAYRFSPDGVRDKSFETPAMKRPQDSEDEGDYADFLRIDPAGNVCIFNGYDGTIARYGPSGKLLNTVKKSVYYRDTDEYGTDYALEDTAFDSNGNILTLNEEPDNTLSKYTPEGERIKTWGGNGVLSAKEIREYDFSMDSLAADAKGNIYILDGQECVVRRLTGDGKKDAGWGTDGAVGNVDSAGNSRPRLLDIESDTQGNIYILQDIPWGEAVIRRLNSNWEWNNWKAASFLDVGKYSLMTPIPGGRLFVVDKENGVESLFIVSPEGRKEPVSLEYKNSGAGIRGVRMDETGSAYLYDSTDTVYKFLPDGKKDGDWGRSGEIGQNEGLKDIQDIAFDAQGRLYAASKGGQVRRFTEKGTPDGVWGENGSAEIPRGAAQAKGLSIAPDAAGFYVSDGANERIVRFDGDGRLDAAWHGGASMPAMGEASGPSGLSKVAVMNRRLYALWDNYLYVLAGTGADGQQPAASGSPDASAAPGGKNVFDIWAVFIWIVGIGLIAALWFWIRKSTRQNRKK
jgi:sugar lactone lactonase YvrE